ncbi:MAG TPA: hypothetical protein VHX86_18025 [Tepidisphaeraceae bacterium]|jgi:hypothetical protein|nr:hypothetical protein [Tepidisphaeraceae bacterium]
MLEGRELLLLKGDGGERFARFVNQLIRGEAHAGGLPQSEVDTQVRGNIADGGVDTRVNRAVPGDQSGHLGVPTCWQFKAEDAADLKKRTARGDPYHFLTVEIQKPLVRQLIALGFGFRFCLLGDLPPGEVSEWENHLAAIGVKINATAPPSRVVSADKLIAWTQRFPFAVAFFYPSIAAELFSFDRLKEKVRADTPQYVPFEPWKGFSETIAAHITDAEVRDACLWVQGEAGVGKTRLVFESLASLPQCQALLAYTSDEQRARTLSEQLANNPNGPNMIVVADECSLETRIAINKNLAGCRRRVRYICLSNTGQRGISGAREIWLEEMPRAAVERILKENFPDVPQERLAAYIDLSGGFIQIAADMCMDNALNRAGDLRPIMQRTEDFIKVRVPDEEGQKVLQLLSLFSSVGAKADVALELKSACDLTGMVPDRVNEVAARLKDAPGYVTIAGRYLSVKPAIVARVAFEGAWKRWVSDDPKAFIESLHPDLVPTFLNRVRDSASEEVKAAAADTFRHWIASLQPQDLNNEGIVARLAILVETDPDTYIGRLRELVDSTPDEVLRMGREWGSSPRRQLVWLCERLAAFPAYYFQCEAILYRLAVNESEPKIGNNSTGIWCQLQRVYLSGSSVPFAERFEPLRKRTTGANGEAFLLCAKALGGIFNTHVTRMGAPATVGGRLRPEDWHPRTQGEERQCWISALRLLQELASDQNHTKSSRAIDIAFEHFHTILRAGFLEEVRQILAPAKNNPDVLAKCIEEIENFLDWEEEDGEPEANASSESIKYFRDIHSWLADISPTSFAGKIRILFSRSTWDRLIRPADGQPNARVAELALEALSDLGLLREAIPFLLSADAKSAVVFGEALGLADHGEVVLQLIFDAVKAGSAMGLPHGYLLGRLRDNGDVSKKVEAAVSRIGTLDVKAEFELRAIGGDRLGAMDFALKAVDEGKIPVTLLSRFGWGNPPPSQVKNILSRFVNVRGGQTDESNNAALQYLSILWHGGAGSNAHPLIEDEDVRHLAWTIAEYAHDVESRRSGYDRPQLIQKLARFDPNRAIGLLLDSLLAQNYVDTHDYSFRALIELARAHPKEVMEQIGTAMMSNTRNGKLRVAHAITHILRMLPVVVMVDWIRKSGIEAMRELARELPLPFVDKEGSAIVPAVSLALLEEFGGDEEVCTGFVRGSFRGDSWMGNGGDHFRAKAASARHFLSHPNRCVRRWAEQEVAHSESLAATEQIRDEERFIE